MPRDVPVELIIKAVDNASDEIKQISQNLNGLSKVVKGLMGAAGAFLVGRYVQQITGQFIDLAREGARIAIARQAFDGLAKSVGRSSDEIIASLKRASAGMLSQRDIIFSYNKAAQLVSKDFANRLSEMMPYLQKVSAATGESMSYMLNSLVVGVGRLSPLILDNLGIQVRLSEATKLAAKMFGVEADKLSKAQIQAAMTELVLRKLQQNTANMPDVTQSATAAWQRFTATMQDARDIIGAGIAPALGKLADGIEPLVRILTPMAASLMGRIADGLVSIVPWVQKAAVFISALSDVLGEYTGKLSALLAKAGIVLQFKDALIALGIAIASFVLPILGTFLAGAAPIIAAIVGMTLAVSFLRNQWANGFKDVKDVTSIVLTFITDQYNAAVQWLINVTGTLWTNILNIWTTASTGVTKLWSGFWAFVGDVLTRATTFVANVFTKFGLFLVSIWGAATKFLSKIWFSFSGWWSENVSTRFHAVLQFIGEVMKRIVSSFGSAWSKAREITGRALQTIGSVVGDALAGVAESVASLFERIPKIGPGIAANIRGAAASIRSAAGSAVSAASRTLGDDGLGGIVSAAMKAISEQMGGLPEVTEKGKNGFLKVIGDLLKNAKDKIGDLGKTFSKENLGKILAGLKEWVGDKVFKQIQEKLAGIKDGAKDNLSKLKDIIRSALGKAGEGLEFLKKFAGDMWEKSGIGDFIQKVKDRMAEIQKDIADGVQKGVETPVGDALGDLIDDTGDKAGKKVKDKVTRTFADVMADAKKALRFIGFQLREGLMSPVEALQAKISVWQRVMEEAFKRGLIDQAKNAARKVRELLSLLEQMKGAVSADIRIIPIGTVPIAAPQQILRQNTYNVNITTSQHTRDVVRDLRAMELMTT